MWLKILQGEKHFYICANFHLAVLLDSHLCRLILVLQLKCYLTYQSYPISLFDISVDTNLINKTFSNEDELINSSY